ncbi:MAG: hypothetical protein KDD44_10625, partial [Bdellovibrionales bacterium]|nr:hypothetical protein [Bdellovibrionales bacterium]
MHYPYDIPESIQIVVGRTDFDDDYLDVWFPRDDRRHSRYSEYPRYAIDISALDGLRAKCFRVEFHFADGKILTFDRQELKEEHDWEHHGYYPVWVSRERALGGGFVRTFYKYLLGKQPDTAPYVDTPLPKMTFAPEVGALSLAELDGTIWVGTSHEGLIGLRQQLGGAVRSIHYAGNLLWTDQLETYPGPQGNMILRILAQRGRLWLGTFMRGLTLFEPGDPFERADDRWVHYRVPYDLDGCFARWPNDILALLWCEFARELADTVTAIEPHGDEGLWVGTLNGLYYLDLRHGAENASWAARVADGVILSLADDGRGHLWVGTSTQVDPADSLLALNLLRDIWIEFPLIVREVWPQPEEPLLRIDYGSNPALPQMQRKTWYNPRRDGFSSDPSWIPDRYFHGTVFALALDPARPGTLFVGTDRGLVAADFRPAPGGRLVRRWHRFSDQDGTLFDADVFSLAPGPDGT